MLNVVKRFFCINWDDHMILPLILLICCIAFIDLSMLNYPGIPRLKPAWSWCMIFMTCYWIQFTSILLRIFCLYSDTILVILNLYLMWTCFNLPNEFCSFFLTFLEIKNKVIIIKKRIFASMFIKEIGL
jgi:hypothetical protein